MTLFRTNPPSSSPTPNPHPPITFCNIELPESSSFKIVGLTITGNLLWNKHISNVYKSANKAISFLYKARRVMNKSSLTNIYTSHVRSRMEYLSPIWSGSSGDSLSKLDRVQAKAMRLLGPAESSNLPLLSHRRAIAGLCAMHRIVHSSAPAPALSLCPPRAQPRPASRTTRHSKPLFLVNPIVKRLTPKYWTHSFIPLMTVTWLTLQLQTETNLKKFKKSISELQLLDNMLYISHDLHMD